MAGIELSPETTLLLAATIVLYVIGIYGLSFAVRGRIRSTEDFLVAGRRLPLPLASATLLATWFGAGTVLTVTDEVRAEGVRRAALDPLGAGLCLLLAGLFFARPLWTMGLLTLCDFYARRFGRRAELVSALVMVPTYFGWVAAQFVALAGLLELFFGIAPGAGILLVALVAMGYTLLGGMWSVTLTDAVQIVLVLLGLVVLGASALSSLGGGDLLAGWARLRSETPAPLLAPVPLDSFGVFADWLAVLAVGALGNIPGQDLMQRVFAARSAAVARRACFVAGAGYLLFGAVPILLGLAARLLVPEDLSRAVLPALAHLFLSPALLVVFTVALVSAVLSTIDSAILSPASVLSQNVFLRFYRGPWSPLALNRIAVVVVTAGSIGMAFAGESAYTLLEDAYELPLVALFVPLALGLYGRRGGEGAAVGAMATGAALWLVHYAAGWERFLEPALPVLPLPVSLSLAACSLLVYLAWPGPRPDRGEASP